MMDGLYSNSIALQDLNGVPQFRASPGYCMVAPSRTPADASAPEPSTPDDIPVDSEWFACRIVGNGPDGQGMYAHCEGYIEVRP